jgi:4-hydroxy-4-methyl-2-oxoglutarate aldolase
MKPLTGRLDAKDVHDIAARPSKSLIESFRKLGDLSSTVSDVLDELGMQTVLPASLLRPGIPDATIVGPALTVRNLPQARTAHLETRDKNPFMEEIEGINQADSGDVLVIQGLADISNMGGNMSLIAARQGIAGAIVDGAVRDVGQHRRIGFPVWSTSISPITGKWRARTVEVNGPVAIHGIIVNPGDLIIADETGVCIVPIAVAEQVLARCEEIFTREKRYHADIAAGVSVPELARMYKPKRPHRDAGTT